MARRGTPVLLGGTDEGLDLDIGELDGLTAVKQTAVEVRDLIDAEVIAGTHRSEERVHLGLEAGRLVFRLLEQPLEESMREQFHILGEEAEHHLHQEVGGVVRVVPALAKPLGDRADLFRRTLSDLFSRLLRLERQRVREDPA